MSTTTIPGKPGPIEPIDLRDALEERYLAYALSTIMHRALPDVRDGLKPVHRRILYAMRELALDPRRRTTRSAPRSSARRWATSIRTATRPSTTPWLRLAQDFAVRYPLIDGQGNFGNIDGDNPGRRPLHRERA